MQRKYILCTRTQELSLIILFKICSYYDIQISAHFSDILVKCSSIENRVQSFYRKLHTNQVKLSTHYYLPSIETKFRLDVLASSCK